MVNIPCTGASTLVTRKKFREVAFIDEDVKHLGNGELPANDEPQQDITISAIMTLPTSGVNICAKARPNGAVEFASYHIQRTIPAITLVETI